MENNTANASVVFRPADVTQTVKYYLQWCFRRSKIKDRNKRHWSRSAQPVQQIRTRILACRDSIPDSGEESFVLHNVKMSSVPHPQLPLDGYRWLFHSQWDGLIMKVTIQLCLLPWFVMRGVYVYLQSFTLTIGTTACETKQLILYSSCWMSSHKESLFSSAELSFVCL
jgi:hypothetical protein